MADITLVATLDTSGIEQGERTIKQSAIAVSRAIARADTEFARLDRQLQQNKISLQQHSQATRKVTRDLEAFKAGQSNVSNMFNNIERQLVGNTRSMNAFGMGVQQTGYQVGDFLVQIQSGTNWMVAFGQQATQLVGILPMFNPALVGLSAGLGIAIPLVTAVGAYFSRASDTAGAMEDSIKKLEDAVQNYTDTLRASQDATGHLIDEFGVTSSVLRQLVKDFEELARIKALDEIGKQVEEFRSVHLHGVESDLENIKDLLMLKGWFAAAGEEVAQFDGLLKTVENSATDLGVRISAGMELRDILLENSGGIDNMTTAQRAFYDGLVQIIQQMEVFNQQLNGNDGTESYIQDMASLFRKAQQRIREENGEAMRNRINDEAEAAEEAKEDRLARAREAAEAERLMGEQLQATLREQSLATYRAEQQAIAETEAYILEMEAVFNAAQQRMRDEEIAATEASLSRLFRARTVMYSIRFAGDASVMSQSLEPSGNRMNPGKTKEELLALGVPEANLENFILKPSPSGSSGGEGGGGGVNPIEQAEEYLQKLQREAEFKSTLIGLSDEQVAQETRREQLLNQLNGYEEGLGNQYSERIEQIIQMEAETRKLMEAEQQREQMMNMIESNIENAFMSIVDGSKSVEDAFKGMLRNIILEIYKTKVAKPAANAVMDLLFSANGNVFNQGMHVKAYADGGVVNRTTAFPMRGGVGVMGEAGPEAIMPLKRGKNGKLGVQMENSGGGAVTIHQSFNFSANGDESVKRIIRGEVPRITEATKAAVVDAKRRGGSYGRAF